MDNKQQIHLWYFVAVFLGLFLVQSWLSRASVTERIPYSTFLSDLNLPSRCVTVRMMACPRLKLDHSVQ
jgi:hypothetical protein